MNHHVLKRRHNESLLSAEEVRSRLNYEPDVGVFTWKTARSNRTSPNAKAGYLNRLGYIRIRVNDRLYMASRLAWLYVHGVWPTQSVDHINGITTDNRIANLREVDDAQNQANSKRPKNNRTGFKGVHSPVAGKYAATITVNRKQIYLGRHDTPEMAHAAYLAAAHKYFGEYARAE